MIEDKLIKKAVNESIKLFKLIGESELEKIEQERISSEISSEDAVAKKSATKSDSSDEAEEEDILKGKEKEENKEENSYDIPEKIPSNIKFNDVIKQLNYLRSGSSTKDDEVKKNLLRYFEELSDSDKKELFVLLSGFATILTKSGSAKEAPAPSDLKKSPKSSDTGQVNIQKTDSGAAPIVVGESANLEKEYQLVLENNSESHRCTNGKIVPFGSEKSIKDIKERIEDVTFSRDSCSKRSESRTYYNGMLKYLRMQLRAANKINES